MSAAVQRIADRLRSRANPRASAHVEYQLPAKVTAFAHRVGRGGLRQRIAPDLGRAHRTRQHERNDALEIYRAAGAAVQRARGGGGPTLIEVKTDRYLGHFEGDPQVYRPKGESEELRRRDPIPALAARLRERGILAAGEEEQLREQAKQRVAAAIEFARSSPYPEPREALQHVFVE